MCFIILQFLKKDMKGKKSETKNSSSQPTKCTVSPGQLHGSPETGGPCEFGKSDGGIKMTDCRGDRWGFLFVCTCKN